MTGGGYGGSNPHISDLQFMQGPFAPIPGWKLATPSPAAQAGFGHGSSPAPGSYPKSAQGPYGGQFSVPQSPPLPGPPLSPLEQLQQQLQQQLAALNISNYLMPQGLIDQQANGAVNSQYDPQIQGLLTNIQQQKDMTKHNQGDATAMYNALADNLAAQIPGMQQQSAAQQAAAANLYNGAKQDISSQYAGQQAQQQQTLDQLGLAAATGGGSSGNSAVAANSPLGGVGEQAANDQKYAQTQADLQNQQAQNQLAEQGASQSQYQASMADNSRLAGSNAVEDLGRQLAQYLTGANSQVTSLRSSKAQALQSMLAQLETQNQQNAQTQYQNAFNNTMATNNFGLAALKEGDSNTNAANTLANQLAIAKLNNGGGGLTTGPTGAASYLAGQYQNNPSEAVKLNQLLQDTLSRPDVENGVHNVNGSNTSNTEAYLIAQLRDQAAKEGVTDQTDINNAINALLAFNGKLK